MSWTVPTRDLIYSSTKKEEGKGITCVNFFLSDVFVSSFLPFLTVKVTIKCEYKEK